MVKYPPDNVGDLGLIPDPGRRGKWQYTSVYYCLENPRYREAMWATVHKITESDRIELLSMHTHKHTYPI